MDTKQGYQEKMEAQLQQLQTKIDELRVKASLAKEDAKDAYQEQMKTLNHKQQEAQAKLQELKSSSENAWQEVKAGMDNALNDLQNAFNKATTHFS